MKKQKYQCLLFLLIGFSAISVKAQEGKYPRLSEYMMERDAEIALAKSAAPDYVSDHATVKVFTASGFQTALDGNNGFVCMVMRGFTGAPTFTPVQVRAYINYDAKTRAPICLDPLAAQTLLPYYELRTKLALKGQTAEQIAESVQAAYAKGQIPKRPAVCFAYMWSADQVLGPVGHWHPHIMVYLPQYTSLLGTNHPQDPVPGELLILGDFRHFAVMAVVRLAGPAAVVPSWPNPFSANIRNAHPPSFEAGDIKPESGRYQAAVGV